MRDEEQRYLLAEALQVGGANTHRQRGSEGVWGGQWRYLLAEALQVGGAKHTHTEGAK